MLLAFDDLLCQGIDQLLLRHDRPRQDFFTDHCLPVNLRELLMSTSQVLLVHSLRLELPFQLMDVIVAFPQDLECPSCLGR